MKRLAILGSTGSIGVSTLEIVAEHPSRFQVVALTAGQNLALLEEQIARFSPVMVAVPPSQVAVIAKLGSAVVSTVTLSALLDGHDPEVVYSTV